MADFKGLLISSVLISVFLISMLSFGLNLSSDNSTNISIADEPVIEAAAETLNKSIIGSRETTSAAWGGLKQGEPALVNDLTLIEISKLATALPSFAWIMFITVMTLISTTLGIPVSVLYGLTTVLLIVIFTSIVSLIRSGR